MVNRNELRLKLKLKTGKGRTAHMAVTVTQSRSCFVVCATEPGSPGPGHRRSGALDCKTRLGLKPSNPKSALLIGTPRRRPHPRRSSPYPVDPSPYLKSRPSPTRQHLPTMPRNFRKRGIEPDTDDRSDDEDTRRYPSFQSTPLSCFVRPSR